MTIDNGSTSRSERPDRYPIQHGLFPGTNELEAEELGVLGSNVFLTYNHGNSHLGGENRVLNDNPLFNNTEHVDITAIPGKSLADMIGEGPLTVTQFLSSKQIAARNLEVAVEDESFNKTAWIMENGEPFCRHCDTNFIPTVVGAKMACTNCGCGRPNDDHGLEDNDFDGMDMVLGMAGCNTLDTASEIGAPVPGNPETNMLGNDMIKMNDANVRTMSRLASTEDYLEVIKTSNSSDLYVRGYMDAMDGKPLDVELAEVSDDYFHGYQQYGFYHQSPEKHLPQLQHDVHEEGEIPTGGAVSTKATVDEARGPLQLTQDREHSVANKLPFPVDVVNKFFEV